ncbi:MAG TPA: SPOR domain-containing protein [Planctomycetota bacterium]|nr:SPOR domain-containing protein [Planctomycetota bacterium]
MSPDRDDEYLEDDAEDRRRKPGALSAGWLRALLVLSALAIVLVITVPYALEWLSPPTPQVTRPALTEPIRTEPAKVERPAPPPATTPAPPVAAVAPEAPAKADAPTAKQEPAGKPESAAKDEPASKSLPAPKAGATSEPAAAATKSGPAKPTQTARAGEPAPAAPKTAVDPVKSTLTPTTASGDYWVQVGLFANGDNAARLAKELRDERFTVEIAPPPANQHEVVVNGATVEAVTAALKGSGTAEASGDVVVVRPALELKDAVALSRRLAGDGLEVRIRRVAAAPASGGTTVYIVRVGGYPTREAAAAGRRELAAKGVGGFVTQGPAK